MSFDVCVNSDGLWCLCEVTHVQYLLTALRTRCKGFSAFSSCSQYKHIMTSEAVSLKWRKAICSDKKETVDHKK